jgi:hypothetical protein
VIGFFTLGGAGWILMFVVNAVQLSAHRREAREGLSTGSLGKWSWGLSVVSLVVAYLAPVPLLMAVVDLRRHPGEEQRPAARRPARMALANSLFALAFLLALVAVLTLSRSIRWTS